MAQLTIIASIKANENKIELVKTELLKLIEATRSEQGCISYDLHQDNNDPSHFVLYENWESPELWQAHTNAPQLAEYLAAVEGAIMEFTHNEMSIIS